MLGAYEEIQKRFFRKGIYERTEDVCGEGIYEIPEVRSVVPGHLVRCGHASPYDVNFGLEAGVAAVCLLLEGMSGVTVVGDQIKYIDTQEAIKERHVDLNLVAVHENLGVCFGRKRGSFKLNFKKVEGKIERHM